MWKKYEKIKFQIAELAQKQQSPTQDITCLYHYYSEQKTKSLLLIFEYTPFELTIFFCFKYMLAYTFSIMFYVSICLHFHYYNIYQICDYFTVVSYFVYQSAKRTPNGTQKTYYCLIRVFISRAHKYSHLYKHTNKTRTVYIFQHTKSVK